MNITALKSTFFAFFEALESHYKPGRQNWWMPSINVNYSE